MGRSTFLRGVSKSRSNVAENAKAARFWLRSSSARMQPGPPGCRSGRTPGRGAIGLRRPMRGSPRVREPRGAQAGREQRAQAPKKKNSRTGLPAAPGMMAAQPRRSGRGHLGQLGRHPSRHRQSTSAKPASPGRQAVGRGTGAARRPTGRRQGRRRRSPRVPAPPRWDRRPRRRGGAAGPTYRTPDRRQIRSPG
jgi:hypothetical protein